MIAGIADDSVKQEIIILVFPETGVLHKTATKVWHKCGLDKQRW